MGVTDNLFLPAIDEIVKAYVGKWGIEKVIELTGAEPGGRVDTDELVKLRRKVQELESEIGEMLED